MAFNRIARSDDEARQGEVRLLVDPLLGAAGESRGAAKVDDAARIVLVGALGPNPLVGVELHVEIGGADADQLRRAAHEMHLDTAARRIPDRAMRPRLEIEGAAELRVDTPQQVAI